MQSIPDEQLLQEWKTDPVLFCKDIWGEKFFHWDKLDEIAQALVDHKRVVVVSGHGLGKTFISARLVLWWLSVYKPSKVVTTARSWPQVKNVLWSEIAKAYHDARQPFGGRLLETELKVDDDWFAVGISPKKEIAETGFGVQRMQGIHSENLLVVIDEAGLVDPDILIAANKLLVSDNNRILLIGNPASPSGPFYKACTSPDWHKIHLSCFDHPNVKNKQIVVPGAVSTDWIEQTRRDVGEESSLWKMSVLGEFPDEGTDTLIPLSKIEAGKETQSLNEERYVIGIDVAAGGRDFTVVQVRQGPIRRAFTFFADSDVRGKVAAFLAPYKARHRLLVIDATGVGHHFVTHFRDLGFSVMAVNFGSSANNKERFANLKAEKYWGLRERYMSGDIEGVDDQRTLNELSSIKWEVNSRGQISIQSKKNMTKSPDFADSLMLCFSFNPENLRDFLTPRASKLGVRPVTAGLMSKVL